VAAATDQPPRAVTQRRRLAWPRWLPPVRLVWITLIVLGGTGAVYLRGLGIEPLLALPVLAALLDLALQRVRFQHVRFPDAALVTGLFLALIFPPTADLLLAGAATAAAIALRHALRARGRPWLNPAASGVFLGAIALGLKPAWWVAVGPWGLYIMLALGGLLLLRTRAAWRLPIVFLAAYAMVTIVVHIPTGNLLTPSVLLLEAADPVMLFFGLFMVAEPRTGPADPYGQAMYSLGVGAMAALFPLGLPTIGVLVALLVGNLSVALARFLAARSAAPAAAALTVARNKRHRRRSAPDPVRERWPIGYRAGVLSLVLVVLIGASVLTAPSVPTGPGLGVPTGQGFGSGSGSSGGGGSPSSGHGTVPQATCLSDNASIASNVRSQLHSALGPSVLLSYAPNSGLVVFYDPVNHVTVTETDLFEDYGYAEFNGDDYAVSGCHP
jgi:Na+-translocating ferredoxin:NAD+ oxidoreductase RnfD subunit